MPTERALEQQSVAAAVLAYSRFELLQSLIAALRAQTRPPDEIIVVNQGSRADMAAWLAEQPDLRVITQENRGSAGGFCTCIEESMRRGHDWTWVFDDDGIPEHTALANLVLSPYLVPETVFMASRVVDPEGRTYMTPPPINPNGWYGTVMADGCVEVGRCCWLGMLVSSDAVRRAGLPIAEFFLFDEDQEFSGRLARHGKAYCAVRSVVVHHQHPEFDRFGKDFIKFAYFVRNRIARAKIEPGSLLKKVYRASRCAVEFLAMVAKREAPLRTVPWVLRGLFTFWPRVRFPGK